jgi:hypothetical protein
VRGPVELILASADQTRLRVRTLDLDNDGCLTAGTIFRGRVVCKRLLKVVKLPNSILGSARRDRTGKRERGVVGSSDPVIIQLRLIIVTAEVKVVSSSILCTEKHCMFDRQARVVDITDNKHRSKYPYL